MSLLIMLFGNNCVSVQNIHADEGLSGGINTLYWMSQALGQEMLTVHCIVKTLALN